MDEGTIAFSNGSISKFMIQEESIKECLRSSQILNAIPSPHFSALWNSTHLYALAPHCPLPSSGHSNWSNRTQAVLAADIVGFPPGLARGLLMSLNLFPNALFSLSPYSYTIIVLEMLTSRI